jgi:hypothetical protein
VAIGTESRRSIAEALLESGIRDLRGEILELRFGSYRKLAVSLIVLCQGNVNGGSVKEDFHGLPRFTEEDHRLYFLFEESGINRHGPFTKRPNRHRHIWRSWTSVPGFCFDERST